MWAPVNMGEMVWSQYKCIKLILKKKLYNMGTLFGLCRQFVFYHRVRMYT